MLSIQEAAARLNAHERIRVLTHQSPDGDTLGCAGALCLGLRALGKQAQYVCADPIPEKYQNMLRPLTVQTFDPDYIVAVDVADSKLLGALEPVYAHCTDLGLDHHGSNTGWTQEAVVDASAGAACEVIALLLREMNVPITPDVADCLYTGLCTDTGCFRYSNTTPRTLRLAAELMESGADAAAINMRMFEIKTRSRLAIERMALDGLEYAFEHRVAIMVLSQEMIAVSGATDSDLDGLAPIPRNIEGVQIGITIRERAPGDYKISVRTGNMVDASALCRTLGGGGHMRAAGCRLNGSREDVVQRMIDASASFVRTEDTR